MCAQANEYCAKKTKSRIYIYNLRSVKVKQHCHSHIFEVLTSNSINIFSTDQMQIYTIIHASVLRLVHITRTTTISTSLIKYVFAEHNPIWR